MNVVAWSCTPESFDFELNSEFKSNFDFKPNSNNTRASDVQLSRLFVYTFQDPYYPSLYRHYSKHLNLRIQTLWKHLNFVTIVTVYSGVDYFGFLFKTEHFFNISHFSLLLLFRRGNCGGAPFLQFPVKYFYFHLRRRPRNFQNSLGRKRQIVTVSSSESGAQIFTGGKGTIEDQNIGLERTCPILYILGKLL